jgi:hypothetical protein
MHPVRIIKEVWNVEARLAELFDVSKAEMVEVALAAVGGRRDAVDDDPITAPGTFSYIFGTRALRRLFRAKAWKRNRAGGMESVFAPERGVKIVFQNADLAAEERRDPKAVSDKGNATERAVRMGQGNLFPEVEEEEIKEATASIWYYFVSCEGDDVRAELSRPISIVDGQFLGFHERIFVVNKGDIADFNFDAGDGEPPQEFDFEVTRK